MRATSAKDIGTIVAAARRHRGLTQSELARQLGVSQNWISEIESGKETAQIGKVLNILRFLQVALDAEVPWARGASRQKESSLDRIIQDLGNASAPPRKRRR